jgi:hypothetical protein
MTLLLSPFAAFLGWNVYTGVFQGYTYVKYAGYVTYATSGADYYAEVAFNSILFVLFLGVSILFFYAALTGGFPRYLRSAAGADPAKASNSDQDFGGERAQAWELRCRAAIDSETRESRCRQSGA